MPPHAGIAVAAPDSSYEALTTAPEDSNAYFVAVVPYPDEVYVVRTNKSRYAKIRGLDLRPGGEFTFEYSYQDDGTRILTGKVPIEQTTWGKVKSLHQ
jgi:hypothetical protein